MQYDKTGKKSILASTAVGTQENCSMQISLEKSEEAGLTGGKKFYPKKFRRPTRNTNEKPKVTSVERKKQQKNEGPGGVDGG